MNPRPPGDPAGGGQTLALPGQNPEGEFVFGVLVKRTYDIEPGGRCRRAAKDRKLLAGDVHFGDPLNTSVRYETDFVPYKLATDVVLDGVAYAPGMTPTREFTASLTVGEARKEIRVIGDRVLRYRENAAPVFTEPQPVAQMELRYERAYGGIDIYSDPKAACANPRNPLGRGYAVANVKRAVDNLELPNLEDPANRLTPDRILVGRCLDWEKQPAPQSFGWLPAYWLPRAALAGVMPAERQMHQELRDVFGLLIPAAQRPLWEQTRLRDMDFRFFNGASSGLVLPYLNGDETVRTVNLTPMGAMTFRLPGERPKVAVDFGRGVLEPPVVLHTVQVRTEDWQVDLVWRAAAAYPGPEWLPEMAKMEITAV